jgi:hypothetical protein
MVSRHPARKHCEMSLRIYLSQWWTLLTYSLNVVPNSPGIHARGLGSSPLNRSRVLADQFVSSCTTRFGVRRLLGVVVVVVEAAACWISVDVATENKQAKMTRRFVTNLRSLLSIAIAIVYCLVTFSLNSIAFQVGLPRSRARGDDSSWILLVVFRFVVLAGNESGWKEATTMAGANL